MTTRLPVSFSLLATLLLACGGSPSEPAAPAPPVPAAGTAGAADPAPPGPLGALCERHAARERACVNEYLDALVGLRIELDQPKGIAAEAAKDGRTALVTRARAEWEVDASAEAVARMCGALDAQVPKERVPSLVAQGERCLAMADCKAFAECAVADQRSFIESGATH